MRHKEILEHANYHASQVEPTRRELCQEILRLAAERDRLKTEAQQVATVGFADKLKKERDDLKAELVTVRTNYTNQQMHWASVKELLTRREQELVELRRELTIAKKCLFQMQEAAKELARKIDDSAQIQVDETDH